jgi:hypothetical protein
MSNKIVEREGAQQTKHSQEKQGRSEVVINL